MTNEEKIEFLESNLRDGEGCFDYCMRQANRYQKEADGHKLVIDALKKQIEEIRCSNAMYGLLD
jgi:hypothetical protein